MLRQPQKYWPDKKKVAKISKKCHSLPFHLFCPFLKKIHERLLRKKLRSKMTNIESDVILRLLSIICNMQAKHLSSQILLCTVQRMEVEDDKPALQHANTAQWLSSMKFREKQDSKASLSTC